MNSTDFIGQRVTVTIDRPLGTSHPKYPHIIYEVNYGYIAGTCSGDGEELDAYILGIDKPIKTFTGFCVAVLRRKEEQDDKLIVCPEGVKMTESEVRKAVNFQEQYFESDILY